MAISPTARRRVSEGSRMDVKQIMRSAGAGLTAAGASTGLTVQLPQPQPQLEQGSESPQRLSPSAPALVQVLARLKEGPGGRSLAIKAKERVQWVEVEGQDVEAPAQQPDPCSLPLPSLANPSPLPRVRRSSLPSSLKACCSSPQRRSLDVDDVPRPSPTWTNSSRTASRISSTAGQSCSPLSRHSSDGEGEESGVEGGILCMAARLGIVPQEADLSKVEATCVGHAASSHPNRKYARRMSSRHRAGQLEAPWAPACTRPGGLPALVRSASALPMLGLCASPTPGAAPAAAAGAAAGSVASSPALSPGPSPSSSTSPLLGLKWDVCPLGVSLDAFLDFAGGVGPLGEGGASTCEVVAQHVVPRTAQQHCRFVDLLSPAKQLGPPTHYICHTWSTPFAELLAAVRAYVEASAKETNRPFLWIDFLCTNLHGPDPEDFRAPPPPPAAPGDEVAAARRPEDLAALRRVIAGCPRVVLVLDRGGRALSRTWVLWELWQASQVQHRDKIVLAVNSWAWEELVHPWATLDASASRAASCEDRRALLVDMLGQGQGRPARSGRASAAGFADPRPGEAAGEGAAGAAAPAGQRSQQPGAEGKLAQLAEELRQALAMGVKRELLRAEKTSSQHVRHHALANRAQALMMYLAGRFKDAEELLRLVVLRLVPKGGNSIPQEEQARPGLELAVVLHTWGLTAEAEHLLHAFVAQNGDLPALHAAATSMLIDVLLERRVFTKAEMLARKAAAAGACTAAALAFGGGGGNAEGAGPSGCSGAARRHWAQRAHDVLRMADVATAQRLHEEAEEHARAALQLCSQHGLESSQEAAHALHLLAVARAGLKQHTEALGQVRRAHAMAAEELGSGHPLALMCTESEADMMEAQERWAEAERLLIATLQERLRVYGPEHHDTLATQGRLAEAMREQGKEAEAEDLERQLQSVGRTMLNYRQPERLRSLNYLAQFSLRRIVERDGTHERAPRLYLAQAHVLYRSKLGITSDAYIAMRATFAAALEVLRGRAHAKLQAGYVYSSLTDYLEAELLFKEVCSMGKLVLSDRDAKSCAQGVADALFGQGKLVEARSVLREAGLADSSNAPASYLRWLNKRVVNFMDKRRDEQGLAAGQAGPGRR